MKKQDEKPKHYGNSTDPLDLIAAAGYSSMQGFCMGNVLKYVFRYQKKNTWQERQRDLDKARFYLDTLIGLENFNSDPKIDCSTPLPSPKELREKYGRK